jgi:hypothetical protein
MSDISLDGLCGLIFISILRLTLWVVEQRQALPSREERPPPEKSDGNKSGRGAAAQPSPTASVLMRGRKSPGNDRITDPISEYVQGVRGSGAATGFSSAGTNTRKIAKRCGAIDE